MVDDWDCMLNQTNIGHNNNKFYVIQVLRSSVGTNYIVWTRWGRVGEVGSNASKRCGSLDDAAKEFKKKFKDKTKNDWDKRDSFVPQPGKYTLIDMGDEDEDEGAMVSVAMTMLSHTSIACLYVFISISGSGRNRCSRCSTKNKAVHTRQTHSSEKINTILDLQFLYSLQELVKLLFDTDMFRESMQSLDIGKCILPII